MHLCWTCSAGCPLRPQAYWQELRDAFGDRVTSVRIENASHALFPEQPDQVAQAVLHFLPSTRIAAKPVRARADYARRQHRPEAGTDLSRGSAPWTRVLAATESDVSRCEVEAFTAVTESRVAGLPPHTVHQKEPHEYYLRCCRLSMARLRRIAAMMTKPAIVIWWNEPRPKKIEDVAKNLQEDDGKNCADYAAAASKEAGPPRTTAAIASSSGP